MKALTLVEVKAALELKECADLEPGPDEAVVQLQTAALNRRDFWITQGMYPGIKTPVVLGSDGAGNVTSTGSGLGNYWQDREVIINPGWDWGDDQRAQGNEFRVLGMPDDGTFATQVRVPAKYLHLKPDHLSWEESAALGLAGTTAFRAVFTQGGLQPRETVLINGVGGGVATFALQFAIATGARTFVTSSSADKIQQAMKLGARGGFDYNDPNWSKAMAEQAGAVDLIIDSAGGAGYNTLVDLAAPGGRIVNYGATTGPPEKLDLFKVFWKQLTIQGSTMGSPSDFTAMLEFVQRHQIRPIIDRVFPLAEGNEAINQMKSSPQFGKYVLRIG